MYSTVTNIRYRCFNLCANVRFINGPCIGVEKILNKLKIYLRRCDNLNSKFFVHQLISDKIKILVLDSAQSNLYEKTTLDQSTSTRY